MKIRSASRGIAALSAAAFISTAASLPVTAGPYTDMEKALCGEENQCSITADVDQVFAGDTFTVDVTGIPGAEVELHVIIDTREGMYGPWGSSFPVTIGADGKALDVEVRVDDLVEGYGGGLLRVMLADSPDTDWALTDELVILTDIPGVKSFYGEDEQGRTVFAAGQGAGFGVVFEATQPGHQYGIQAQIDGKWVDLKSEGIDHDGNHIFVVPEGLAEGFYPARIKNLTTGATGRTDTYVMESAFQGVGDGGSDKPEPGEKDADKPEPSDKDADKPGKDSEKKSDKDTAKKPGKDPQKKPEKKPGKKPKLPRTGV